MTIRQDYRYTIYDKPSKHELPEGKVRSDGTIYGTIKTPYGFTGIDAQVYRLVQPTGIDGRWSTVGSNLYTGTCLYVTGMFGSYSGVNQIIDWRFDGSIIDAQHGDYYGLMFRTDQGEDADTRKFTPDVIISIQDSIGDLGLTPTGVMNIYQGPQGVTGIMGIDGAPGIQGTTGLDGAYAGQGVTGLQGATGVGYAGTDGATGLQGPTGPQGMTGMSLPGLTGLQGATGLSGSQGETGAQGTPGLRGETGASIIGATGLPGSQGETGAQGVNGIQGETGASIIGATGAQGIAGSQGATGLTGLIGPQGSTGAGGSAGVQGETGASIIGATGAQGATGLSGTNGATGAQGVAGITYTEYNAGDVGITGLKIDWANGLSQRAFVIANGATGLIHMIGGSTGAHGTLRILFNVNESPKFTGIQWADGGIAPSTTGYTGAADLFAFYYSGDYYGIGALNFRSQV